MVKNFAGARGFYRLSMMSGLLAGVAAGSATAGHLFALNWNRQDYDMYLIRARLRWQTRTAFTAAQELAFKLFKLDSYTVTHTGGTAVNKGHPALCKEESYPATLVNFALMATTTALGAGTHVISPEPLMTIHGWSQQGAAPNVDGFEATLEPDPETGIITRLGFLRGLLVRNEILMGAGGDGRLTVELEWAEGNLASVV